MLTDIATMSIGKTKVNDVNKSLYSIARNLYREPLNVKNKLRTTLTIGNAENTGKIGMPSDCDGVFASWRNELNRQPKQDCFKLSPLNKVKKNSNNDDLKAAKKAFEYTQWLKEVDERMKNLGFKE